MRLGLCLVTGTQQWVLLGGLVIGLSSDKVSTEDFGWLAEWFIALVLKTGEG